MVIEVDAVHVIPNRPLVEPEHQSTDERLLSIRETNNQSLLRLGTAVDWHGTGERTPPLPILDPGCAQVLVTGVTILLHIRVHERRPGEARGERSCHGYHWQHDLHQLGVRVKLGLS